jgi:hypothetical protein
MKFQGRGRIYIAERNNSGIPGAFKFVGCADAFNVALSVETIQHFSKCTSADALDYQGTKTQSAEVSMTLSEWVKANILLALRAVEVPDTTSGTVSNEACGTGFVAGDVYLLGSSGGQPRTNVSAVTVDDAGGPLVLDTDYTLNADTGTITFLTLPSGAVTADYTYDDLPYASMFRAGQKDFWVRFDGVNKADGDNPVVVDLYKVQFNPAQNLDMLPDELALIELSGAVLVDENKTEAGDMGQFGRMTLLETA